MAPRRRSCRSIATRLARPAGRPIADIAVAAVTVVVVADALVDKQTGQVE